jgi:hypothetical protein
MIKLILGAYALLSAVATIPFIALSLVSKRLESEALEPIEEFESVLGDRRADFDHRAAE